MAKYELPIYGENDEIVKTYTTNHVPWAVFIQAVEIQETFAGKSPSEQTSAVGRLLKAVFANLTDAELERADAYDVMAVFKNVVDGGQKIKGGNEKN